MATASGRVLTRLACPLRPPCPPWWKREWLQLVAISLVALSVTPAAAQRKTAPPKAPAAAPAPKAPPKTEQPVPFHIGEKLEFDVGWSSYLTAGAATITVQEKKPSYGSTAWYVVAEGRPTPLVSKLYNLYYKVDTLVDVFSLLPQRGSVYSEESRRHRMKVTLFDQAANKASYEIQTTTVVKKELRLPKFTQDGLSALYVLRSLALTPGDKFEMPVTDNGNLYTVQVSIGKPEPIKTGLGELQAIKVTPVIKSGDAPSRSMAIWFSADARHLPVRMEAQLLVGKFTLVLRQVTG
jgi:hypothetical protein